MSARALLTLALAALATPAVAAPSFDCRKAAAPVEKAICADAALATLDVEVAAAYARAADRVAIDPAAVTRLRDTQRAFVAERNKAFSMPGYDLAGHLADQRRRLDGWPASASPMAAADVAEWLKGLPGEAFDATTAGIETEAALKALVTTGENDEFRLTRRDARHAVVAGKTNGDRVHLTLKALPEPMLEVVTRNERATTWSYWSPPGADGRLERRHPAIAVQAANEIFVSGDGDVLVTGVPLTEIGPELARHLAAREACQHWSGEVGDDLPAARRRQIAEAVKKLGCDRLPAEESRLRRAAAAKPNLLAVLDRAKELLGD